MPHASPQIPEYIPLSQRPSHALWARADELARMAATATNPEARLALEALVARFAALAAKREFAETMEMGTESASETALQFSSPPLMGGARGER